MSSDVRRAFSVAVYARRGDRVLVIEHRRLQTWLPIGGELEPGETPLEAAVRELREETGLVLDTVPAPFREEDFEPDQRWHPYQRGHWAWYDIRTDRFDPSREGWTDEERADVIEWRWMTADELGA
ncbi:MAG TPA: NUDIX domain-containing protein, partial [Kofleriaceae bacterium]